MVHSAQVCRRGHLVDLTVSGEGFLRGQIRSVAGALTAVGLHRQPVAWVADLLRTRERVRAPKTAPAQGLTLIRVVYEEQPGPEGPPR